MNNLKNLDDAEVDDLNLGWESLQICKPLASILKKEFKFKRMTPVQAAAIPLMLANKDVIVEAKTGSGKTLAFLIPLIESLIRLDEKGSIEPHDVLALILSPTRELAAQIHQELRKILKNPLLESDRRLVHQLIVGGSNVTNDLEKYAKHGANIIVATPGRLSAILEMRDNKLASSIRRKLAYLIFDEADQLLSFGFERNLSSILAYLPKQRRTSLFSATQTSQVEELAKAGLRNPIRVDINQLDSKSSSVSAAERRSAAAASMADCDNAAKRNLLMPDKLANYFKVCDSYAHKLAVVVEMLRQNEHKKMLVFLSTCSQIDYFAKTIESELKGGGANKQVPPILKLHRRLKNKRKAIFKKFKSSKRCVLLVTDILSRGIDVPDIECVVHLDLPTSPECYVHRSGRSGHQIELSGVSLLLLEVHELDYVEMCRRRQITMHPFDFDHKQTAIVATSTSLINRMRECAQADAEMETLGLKAFVSYIRYYSSKLCLRQLLFPKVPVAQLAHSFGLLRLPKMPELRKRLKEIQTEFERGPTGSSRAPNETGHATIISDRCDGHKTNVGSDSDSDEEREDEEDEDFN